MQIGICCKIEAFPGTPGVDYVEGAVADALCPLEDEARFAARLAAARALPLPMPAVNMLFPKDLKSLGPQIDHQRLDQFMAVALDRSRRLGVKLLVYGSGGSRRVPDDFSHKDAEDQLVENLSRWAPLAEANRVTLVMEGLHRGETNVANTVDEVAQIVRRVQSKSIRMLVDTFHMARNDEMPEAITRAGELIVHVHCAEGKERHCLGVGYGEDHRPYFRALKQLGYDGRVSIEAMAWRVSLAADLPAGVAELRKQWESA